MYVATVGPAEAYLIRQARLSTLPDPHRERGLPSGELEPDVWRGEISFGDSLVLVSPNVVARLGPEELKDAMLTLHPQSAMEHLHHRFVAAEGSGSDGAIAFEATEVSATARQRTLVPVRPAEPLAGAPDRSPIPLADNVQAAGTAVRAASANAKTAAGSAFERVVVRAQDLLPRRRPAYRRVTPLASRRETQRRAAVALLAFLVVFGGLGLGVWAFAPGGTGTQAISSIDAGQRALELIRANLNEVTGPGVDLVEAEPERAGQLLTEAYEQLSVASQNGIGAATIEPLREQTVEGLDRLSGVVPVTSRDLYTLKPKEGKPPIDLKAACAGRTARRSCSMPRPRRCGGSTSRTRRRRPPSSRARRRVAEPSPRRSSSRSAGATCSCSIRRTRCGAGEPPTRTARARSRRSGSRVRARGATTSCRSARSCGSPARASTTCTSSTRPRSRSRRTRPPVTAAVSRASIRTGSRPIGRPDTMSALHIDGDLFTLENGAITRFVSGKNDGWEGAVPNDTLLRAAPSYSLMAGGGERREGVVYGYDRRNARLIAISKGDGHYIAQYRLADGADGWEDMRGFYVAPPGDDPEAAPVIVWISRDGVHQATLEAVTDEPGASPGPSAGTSAAPSSAP